MRLYTTENIKTYKDQEKMAWLCFSGEGINLIFLLINAFRCNTAFIWADVVENIAAAFHGFLVAIVARKMKKGASDDYNYGVLRLEAFTSFICDVLVIIGMIIVFGVAIYGLFHPEEPSDDVNKYILLKFFNTSFDLYYVFLQYKIYKTCKSNITRTELNYDIYCAATDFIFMAIGIVCYLLRNSNIMPYLNSIFTLVVTSYFAYKCIERLKVTFQELSDHSISIKDQDKLFDIVLENSEDIKKINYVNCHLLNAVLHIDMNIEFRSDLTYKEQRDLLKTIDIKIKDKYPNSVTNFVIGEE